MRQFFGDYVPLRDATAFSDWLAPLRKCEWVVYAKRTFAEHAAVLAYLSRYTASGGDLEQPAPRQGRAWCDIQVEGLPCQWQDAAQVQDAWARASSCVAFY
jgi:hypothetical protein